MIIWMFYVVIVSALLGLAALAAERAALVRHTSTRWYWILAIVASLILPTLISSVSIEIPSVTNHTQAEKKFILKEVTSPYLSPALWVSRSQFEGTTVKFNNELVKKIWMSLSTVLLFVLLVSAAQLYWRKRKWMKSSLLNTPVLLTDDVGPAVVGLMNSHIVIPSWVINAPISQQKAIIAHEQSHLEAGDPLLLTIALSLLVFMPWNLPLWWQLYRLRRAIEIDCDARVLKQGQTISEYGETLIVVGARHSGYIGAVAGMSESNSFLEKRIKIMLTKQKKWWRVSAVAMVLVSFCFLAIAAQVSPPNAANSSDPVQNEISLSAAELEKYTGTYNFNNSAVMTISREGAQLFAQFSNQPRAKIYPKSQSEFFSKIMNSSFTFLFDGRGNTTAVMFHMDNVTSEMPRIDSNAAAQIENKIAQKFNSQTPTPGSEAALRGLIVGLASGTPDYSTMEPGFAQITKEQLPKLHHAAKTLGEIKNIEFRKVSERGLDVFTVVHENGDSGWRIKVDDSGTILEADFNAGL